MSTVLENKKSLLKQCLVLILFSCICALAYNAFSTDGIALVGEWDTEKGVVSAVRKRKPVDHDLEIDDVMIAKEIFDSGHAVFVDARSVSAFNEGHIRGAVSFPIGKIEEKIETFLHDYSTSTKVVTYCSGRECEDSHELAQFFILFGYNDVSVFIDGYPAWEENGFPTEPEDGLS